MFAVSQGVVLGWTSPLVIAAVVAAAVAAVAFAKAETRHPEPLVRLSLLHRTGLRDGSTLSFLLGLWNGGEMLVLSLYLQQVLHDSPLFTGLAIAPQGVVGFSMGLLGPRLARRLGVKRLLVLTGAAAAIGFAVLTRLPAGGYSPVLLVVMLIGFGTAGTAFGSIVLASRGMADSDQGLVGGMINTSRQIGAAVGAALLPAVAVGVSGGVGGLRRPGRDARRWAGRAGRHRRGLARRAPGSGPYRRLRSATAIFIWNGPWFTLAHPLRAALGKVSCMEYRALGRSGLRVSVLTMGTMTFGGTGPFADVGSTDVEEAERQVDICLDAGVNLIDTADVYSVGLAEEILGQVLRGRRDRVLVATKVRMGMGRGPNDSGLSRHHIISGCEASLRRLGTDHIDLYQVHEWDGQTPLEETLHALDDLVRSGKVRYVGASNYTSWQLMKALGIAGGWTWPRWSVTRSTTPCRLARRSTS